MRYKVILFAALLFIILSFYSVPGKAYTLQLYLKLSNTNNNIYIPVTNIGARNANSLGTGTNYTNQTYNYLVSYDNNKIQGLVANVKANRLFVKNDSTTHTLMIEQNITNEKIFLVLSKGDYSIVNNRMRSIVDGTFLSSIKPTFGFGLGTLYPVKMFLNYTNIDIQGTAILQRGRHGLLINYTNVTNSKPVINIERI